MAVRAGQLTLRQAAGEGDEGWDGRSGRDVDLLIGLRVDAPAPPARYLRCDPRVVPAPVRRSG